MHSPGRRKVKQQLTRKQRTQLNRGKRDKETYATIYVMLYYTQEFEKAVSLKTCLPSHM